MKKQRIRSWYNWKREPEKLKKGSLTIPGESMTVRQIFERHRAGIIDGVNHSADFDEDEEFIPPDRNVVDSYDLTSIDDAVEYVDAKKAEKKKKEVLEEERKKEDERMKHKESEDEVRRTDKKLPNNSSEASKEIASD